MAHEHEWELDGRCDSCEAIAHQEYERLRAENDRLCDALEAIYRTYCTAVHPTPEMGRTARKALAGTDRWAVLEVPGVSDG